MRQVAGHVAPLIERGTDRALGNLPLRRRRWCQRDTVILGRSDSGPRTTDATSTAHEYLSSPTPHADGAGAATVSCHAGSPVSAAWGRSNSIRSSRHGICGPNREPTAPLSGGTRWFRKSIGARGGVLLGAAMSERRGSVCTISRSSGSLPGRLWRSISSGKRLAGLRIGPYPQGEDET